MSYLLYQSDNLVGVFDDLQKAKDMAQSVINNGWAKNFSVVKYKLNTCLKLTTLVVDEDNNIETEEDFNINELEEDNIKKQKLDIQTKLNLLKIQKDKIEESRTKYDIDLKLYNEFKNKLDEDINFEIPELFQEKYKIFHQLDSQDNLDWETFSLLYKEPDFHGNFTNVFELTNDFETKFLSNLESDTEDDDSDEDTTDNVIEVVQVLNSSEEGDSSSD